MQCTVKWAGNNTMAFDASTETGHAIRMDGAPEHGGQNSGPRPMEMLLVGAGGCTAFDVVMILKKSRQPIVNVDVSVTAERAENEPKVFTKIHLHFVITGEGVKEAAVKRAIELSHDKYCSATIMLSKTANVTTSYTIEQA